MNSHGRSVQRHREAVVLQGSRRARFFHENSHIPHTSLQFNRDKTNMRHIHTSIVSRHLATIDVCIWRMFVFMSVVVTVWGSVGIFVV